MSTVASVSPRSDQGVHPWWQALPFAAVFLVFFVIPLGLVLMVSFWDFNEYELLPAFTWRNYVSMWEGCGRLNEYGDFCVTLSTYLSTLKFALLSWALTLVLGFALAGVQVEEFEGCLRVRLGVRLEGGEDLDLPEGCGLVVGVREVPEGAGALAVAGFEPLVDLLLGDPEGAADGVERDGVLREGDQLVGGLGVGMALDEVDCSASACDLHATIEALHTVVLE